MATSNLHSMCAHEEELTFVIPMPTDNLSGSSGSSGTSQIQVKESNTDNFPIKVFNNL
jgi:hypothetical protein